MRATDRSREDFTRNVNETADPLTDAAGLSAAISLQVAETCPRDLSCTRLRNVLGTHEGAHLGRTGPQVRT